MRCKHCNSKNLVKAGTQGYGGKRYQRYLCNDCIRISRGEEIN